METDTVIGNTPNEATASFSLRANSFLSRKLYPGNVVMAMCMMLY